MTLSRERKYFLCSSILWDVPPATFIELYFFLMVFVYGVSVSIRCDDPYKVYSIVCTQYWLYRYKIEAERDRACSPRCCVKGQSSD